MSFSSWLPATLAATVIAAGSLLVPAPVQAQEVTVLRGSPSPPSQAYASNQDNNQDNQDNQPSTYSPSSYDDNYPYYGDDFPLGVGGLGRGFHRGDFIHRGLHGGFHRGFHIGFHGGGFHADGFHGGGFHGGGFHGGGFHGGDFHGGGGHR
jgi:hypothetical protein